MHTVRMQNMVVISGGWCVGRSIPISAQSLFKIFVSQSLHSQLLRRPLYVTSVQHSCLRLQACVTMFEPHILLLSLVGAIFAAKPLFGVNSCSATRSKCMEICSRPLLLPPTNFCYHNNFSFFCANLLLMMLDAVASVSSVIMSFAPCLLQ